MSRNWGYTRKFIILKKDFSNMQNFNPKGHGKLELRGIKGILNISIENAEENNYYNVVLLNGNDMETIGKVYTEENGKGKAEIPLNIQDLEAKGFSVENINGILLLRDSNILLGGYIEKEDGSIERYINSLSTEILVNEEEPEVFIPQDEEEIEEEIAAVEEEEEVVEEVDEVDEVAVEEVVIEEEAVVEETFVQEEVLVEEVPEVVMEEIEEEIVTEEVEEYIDPKYLVEAKEPTYEPIQPTVTSPPSQEEVGEEIDYDNLSAEYNRRIDQRNQTTNYILSILRFFPYINPFNINLQGYNWWRIDYQEGLEERGFLPYFSYLVGSNNYSSTIDLNAVTAKDLLGKYEHYIFGLYNVKDEVKYYVYGVPGEFKKEEHPSNGKTGFNTWFEGNEIAGYWLLFIDPLSGRVIYPANPMEPAN